MSTTHVPVATLIRPLHIVAMISPRRDTARVAVSGEVDLATAPDLRERLLSVLRTHGPAVLDIDLAQVTFLDCIGIGALVAVRNAAVHKGCQVRVCQPQPIVRRILEVSRLLDVLTVEPQQLQARPPQPLGSTRRL